MLRPGADLYFRDPAIADERVLVHARFESGDDALSCAELDATKRFEAGQEVLIYYEKDREFVQRPVRIETLDPRPECDGALAVGFVALGDPVSAESRQHYRVSTQSVELEACVAGDGHCPVQDLSATGFAALVPAEYAIGAAVGVDLDYEGIHCEGQAVVQSACTRREGNRYGFLATDAGSEALRASLNQVSLAVQREQLRRISGG